MFVSLHFPKISNKSNVKMHEKDNSKQSTLCFEHKIDARPRKF